MAWEELYWFFFGYSHATSLNFSLNISANHPTINCYLFHVICKELKSTYGVILHSYEIKLGHRNW